MEGRPMQALARVAVAVFGVEGLFAGDLEFHALAVAVAVVAGFEVLAVGLVRWAFLPLV